MSISTDHALKSFYVGLIGLTLICFASSSVAVCGDGVIDLDANGVAIESCDLGASNNNDPASLSGCDTSCKTKLGGWTCSNTMAGWTSMAQTDTRSLKNLFITLLQKNRNNVITASTVCDVNSTMQPCFNYRKELYEFKRLNVNNSINSSAKLRCMYAGDSAPSQITLIDPDSNSTYTVNCGTDDPQNPVVPVS